MLLKNGTEPTCQLVDVFIQFLLVANYLHSCNRIYCFDCPNTRMYNEEIKMQMTNSYSIDSDIY